MTFTPIDPATWPRRDYYYYFTKMAPMRFTLTATLDVAAAHARTKALGLRFFPVYLYVVAKAVAAHPEFCVAQVDGRLGRYDALAPSYTLLDTAQRMVGGWTAYQPDFAAFYRQFLADEGQALAAGGPQGRPNRPANAFDVGMIPWLHFDSYVPQPASFAGTFPVVQAGGYDATGRMPLSVCADHAVADGYHVAALFKTVQDLLTTPSFL
ncbi:CatA-like O-acetyltransferase [Lacticaseibacillus parakribbianus]|uniref:CatA-like O-acetyltransferase n=1 Tax=Lacticaseibacillus parakribbianus TaxID=2970927 RepID=UPI0021CB4C76|nr:CatA-like O-acetyltransferase [Lacticaseibacillus parakribbianus]